MNFRHNDRIEVLAIQRLFLRPQEPGTMAGPAPRNQRLGLAGPQVPGKHGWAQEIPEHNGWAPGKPEINGWAQSNQWLGNDHNNQLQVLAIEMNRNDLLAAKDRIVGDQNDHFAKPSNSCSHG